MSLEEVFLTHTGFLNFPREFGKPDRIPIYDKDEYLDAIQKYNGVRPCYVSVYHYLDIKDYSSAIIDKIFIDLEVDPYPKDVKIDLGLIWKALLDTKKLVKTLNYSDIFPRVYFSGRKGFSVYIDFPSVELDYPCKTLKKFVFRLKGVLNLKHVDTVVIGELGRLSRVPNTLHIKSGYFCIPLGIKEFFEFQNVNEILNLAAGPRFCELVKRPSNKVKKWLLKLDEEIDREEKKEAIRRLLRRKKGPKTYSKGIRPIVKKIMDYGLKSGLSGGTGHQLRLVIATELINNGWSDDQIWDYFSQLPDRNEQYTRDKLDYLRDENYHTFTTKKIKEILKEGNITLEKEGGS